MGDFAGGGAVHPELQENIPNDLFCRFTAMHISYTEINEAEVQQFEQGLKCLLVAVSTDLLP